MVTCENSKLQPHLIEMNSEPALDFLMWVLEDLFTDIARVAMEPCLDKAESLEGGRHWKATDTYSSA